MHPIVRQLVALQEVDSKVAGVQRKLDAIPRETAKRARILQELRQKRDEVRKTIRSAEEENQELEGRVRALDAAIKRQQEHRDKAANAAAYTAAMHQIEYLSQDKENLQNRQLELMELIEQQAPGLAGLESGLEQAEAEFAAFEAEADKLCRELVGQRESIAGTRQEYLAAIPQPNLVLYEDMFRQHGGHAVVPAEGGYCSGCNTRLTPNDMAYLRSGSTLISCKSCGRILYLPEA